MSESEELHLGTLLWHLCEYLVVLAIFWSFPILACEHICPLLKKAWTTRTLRPLSQFLDCSQDCKLSFFVLVVSSFVILCFKLRIEISYYAVIAGFIGTLMRYHNMHISIADRKHYLKDHSNFVAIEYLNSYFKHFKKTDQIVDGVVVRPIMLIPRSCRFNDENFTNSSQWEKLEGVFNQFDRPKCYLQSRLLVKHLNGYRVKRSGDNKSYPICYEFPRTINSNYAEMKYETERILSVQHFLKAIKTHMKNEKSPFHVIIYDDFVPNFNLANHIVDHMEKCGESRRKGESLPCHL